MGRKRHPQSYQVVVRWPGEKEKLEVEVEGLGNFGCTRIPMEDNHRVDGKVPAQS